METPSIIITVDYEVVVDGSGDVRQLIIEPMERLLNILHLMLFLDAVIANGQHKFRTMSEIVNMIEE